MTEHPLERTGDSLCSLVDLWEIVSETLGITTKQAAEFVEQKVESFGSVLWVDDTRTGLWKPASQSNSEGDYKDRRYLLDA